MKTEDSNEIKQQALQELELAESFMVISRDSQQGVWRIIGTTDDESPMSKFMVMLKDAFIKTAEEHPELGFRITVQLDTKGGD